MQDNLQYLQTKTSIFIQSRWQSFENIHQGPLFTIFDGEYKKGYKDIHCLLVEDNL